MKKFIFLSDVDGTLLRGKSGIHPSVVSAAKAFMDKGGLLTLCTGRAPVSARSVTETLNVNMPCILFTGAGIYDFSKKSCIWSKKFDFDKIIDTIKKVYDNFPFISIQAYSQDKIFILRKNERLIARGISEEKAFDICDINDLKGDIIKLVLTCDNVDTLCLCRDEIFSSDSFVFDFASTHFAEVVPNGAGKAAAMEKLGEIYSVPMSRFFAAGDGMTDLPMIKKAFCSFAPINSAPPLLDFCTHQIPTCEDGGMAKAFEIAMDYLDK